MSGTSSTSSATYNALLGGPGQLGCCLLIEIDDPVVRDTRLREWRALPAYVYIRCEGGATVRPTVDPAQVDEHRISAVQYLKFHLDDWRPISVGCDLPGLIAETTLNREQRDALNDDLRSTGELNNVSPAVGTALRNMLRLPIRTHTTIIAVRPDKPRPDGPSSTARRLR